MTVAVVLVLGDVGRSPRMQYHALSLARSDATTRVYLVGYRGERAVPAVEADSKIEQVLLASELLPRPKARALYLAYAPAKALLLLLQLLWTLLVVLPRADVLLLQTPPAVPALAAAWLVRALRGGRVVVDWHNLGFTVLSHALRSDAHPFVRLSFAYERLVGRLLDGHLCVTDAMAQWLRREWKLRDVRVLHDRPPEFFKRLELSDRHELYRKLRPQFVDPSGAALWPGGGEGGGGEGGGGEGGGGEGGGGDGGGGGDDPWADGGTPWTVALPKHSSGGEISIVERCDRPALLVSSTSWTADEDFGMLLQALTALDATLRAAAADDDDDDEDDDAVLVQGRGSAWQGKRRGAARGPQVIAVITGKGPLKASYEERMTHLQLARVAICTMWLEPADYPRLLGAADLGVCLHTSTSGLDLPMKVLDMFGCGLPVCAVSFQCLPELITDGSNGLVFRSVEQLAEQLESLTAPHEDAENALRRLRDGVATAESSRPRWAENWKDAAEPLLLLQQKDGGPNGGQRRLPWLFVTLTVLLLGLASCALLALVLAAR